MRIVRNNDENGSNLDKHFRELRNLETQPAPDLLDKLEYSLDGDRERMKYDHWYKALIMLLIPFTVINIFLTYDLPGYYGVATDGAEQIGFQQRSPSSNVTPNSLKNSGGWGNFFNGDFLSFIDDNESKTDAVAIAVTGNDKAVFLNSFPEISLPVADVLNHNGETVSPELSSPLDRKMLETSATPADLVKYHSRKMVNERASSVKGFHIGIEGGVNNNWMLHKNNSLHPLIGNKIHRKFDIGATYGISAGYDFSSRCGIEAEWIIRSQQGQEYEELRYGKILVNGEVNLEYMHLPIMFKYKWTKIPARSAHPHVLNLVTGIQYSRLRDAQVVQNGLDIENVNELFNRDELGLLLGLEYDIFVHRNYFFSMGARASISTDARAFPYFNSEKTETYNLLIGLNASFNYLAKRKKKD